MKLLLDENVPKLLKRELTDHQVFTVDDQGWRAIKNGELLRLMIASEFDALITLDRALQYQQNFQKYPIPVIILKPGGNDSEILQRLVPELTKLLRRRRLKPGPHELTLNLN